MRCNLSSIRCLVALASVTAMIHAAPASAQIPSVLCEGTPTLVATSSATQGSINGVVSSSLNAGLQAYTMSTMELSLHAPTQTALNNMSNSIMDRMKQFWKDWNKAWHDMSAQLSAGTIDGTRQLTSIADVTNGQNPTTTYQETEYDTKMESQPSVEGCGFDTTARYNNAAMQRSKGLSSALANDMKKLGVNNKGTPGAQGSASMQANKWSEYVNTFCDPNANGGHAGCTQAGTMVNADIQPSKTILARDTIDMSNADIRKAVNAVTYNVIGYKVPDTLKPTELKNSVGKEKRNRNREYLTQMDAVSALITQQIAERSPGEAAPEIKAKRMANGIHACASGSTAPGSCASDNPSEWEVRQSVIEEIRNPNYYINLSDSSDSTIQKEVMLQAYNVMMMFKILEKSAVISNAMAIQAGNMLERTDTSRFGGSKFNNVEEPASPTGGP